MIPFHIFQSDKHVSLFLYHNSFQQEVNNLDRENSFIIFYNFSGYFPSLINF